jgi:hypothetical protein
MNRIKRGFRGLGYKPILGIAILAVSLAAALPRTASAKEIIPAVG